MKQHQQNKFRWLAFVLLLALTMGAGYFHYRQQIFEVFAAGTEWVLVTCGFQPEAEAERSESLQSDQLRKLLYAVRMFNSPPPEALSKEDAKADKKYPGVGFGLVHTFNRKPVPMVIGGWLFSIPCTYFADARDCPKTGSTVARLKVSADDLQPISEDSIVAFLAASSPEVVGITLAGLNGRAPQWWQNAAVPAGYQARVPTGFNGGGGGLLCTDPQGLRSVSAHCLLRFMQGSEVFVEIKFALAHRDNWAELQRQAQALVGSFQVRR